MNEELKIIITAVTGEAKKGIQGIKKELGGVSKGAKEASNSFGSSVKNFVSGSIKAKLSIAALAAGFVMLSKQAMELNKVQAKLNTAFLSVGSTAQQAAESYQGLFRFLGDSDKSVEAASHLAKLTTNQKELAEWTKICQGIYATFGDSLPIEGLTEAANETARVGKVTGTMADALNWAGVSEDQFNAKLAATTSYTEREALIRETLNGLYSDAAEIYEKNNKALLEYNEAQSRMQNSIAATFASVQPLVTSLLNLGSALLDILKPALDVIIPAITTFVNWVTQGVRAVLGLLGAVTGASASISSLGGVGASLGSAASGANNLASGLDDAAKSAEKAKKATMGFDELNVVSSGSSSSGSGSGSSNAPGYMAPTVNAANFTMEVEETEKKSFGLVDTLKKAATVLKDVFAPTITAWTSGFDTIKQAWDNSKENFLNGAISIKDAFSTLGSYVVSDFVPTVVNSFSENLAPVITDLLGLAIEESGKTFELYGYLVNDITQNIILPVLELLKEIYTGVFTAIGDGWAAYGQPVMDAFVQAMDHVRNTVVTIYEEFLKPIIESVITMLVNFWTGTLKPLVNKIVDAVLEIGQCLLQLYNEFVAPIIDWIVANILPWVKVIIDKCIDYVGGLLTAVGKILSGVIDVVKGLVQFIVGVFTGDWSKAWEGIKNVFNGIWEAIKGIALAAWEAIKHMFDPDIIGAFFIIVWETIKGVFSSVATWFTDMFTAAWNGSSKIWSGAKNFFSGIWKDIRGAFGNVTDWFKNTFTKAWTAVKNVFSKGGKVFDGIKDGILDGLKAVINTLIGGINKVIAIPFNGLNDALETLKDLSILGVEPFGWIDTIPVPEIPKLARGGIVDQATLALIGEQGKEAVVPLENNTGWIDKLVDKLAARNDRPEKIVLMLDGKELGWANINSINNITRQTGALQLVIA